MHNEHGLRQVECLLQWHKVVRATAIGTSIVVARHLFLDGFHYPLLLLLAHTVLALAFELSTAKNDTTALETRQSSSRIQWIWQIIFSALVAAGLVFAYQAMLHTRNATMCLMTLGLTWVTVERAATLIVCSSQKPIAEELLRLITIITCIGLLFWNERMLGEKGIQLMLYAAACGALAKFLYDNKYAKDQLHFRSVRIGAYASGLITCILLVALLFGLSGWHKRRDFHLHGRLLWVLASLVAGVVSISSNTILERVIPGHSVTFNLPLGLDLGSPSLTLLLVAAVTIDNEFVQHRPTITSAEQWFAFAIGCASTIDLGTILAMADPTIDVALKPASVQYEALQPDDTDEQPSQDEAEEEVHALDLEHCGRASKETSWRRQISLPLQSFFAGFLLLLVVFSAMHLVHPRHDPTPVRRGRSNTGADLDVVIAWYEESYDHVIDTAALAFQASAAKELNVRTIVYNKGSLNETELRSRFPADHDLIIRNLDNVGREGHTYLSHLLGNSNDFSPHTIFIQAEPHEPGYLQARLQNYLASNTGFLSLSYARNLCSNCDKCNDHSGWHVDGSLLRDIFERSNNGKTCGDISLTYRGQFVVSDQRMKHVDRALLLDLEHRLREDDAFGYTLERLWGTLFQCPTVSQRCPTLLSGWLGRFDRVSDCQCLDSIPV
ncbi:hypothetical protein AC578_8701 [Pseudocercospora eumusae]|uniref:Uncharacterized protein n=1 Tax=Pseudocercospora eumusae TaxID=321146 RepID=A0A139HQ40_9PEZI|nr:hypothetical protein AC578_8701 [Pseudocercospora eumusae]